MRLFLSLFLASVLAHFMGLGCSTAYEYIRQVRNALISVRMITEPSRSELEAVCHFSLCFYTPKSDINGTGEGQLHSKTCGSFR